MKPAILKGEVMTDYFVDENGDIWSNKTGKMKKRKPGSGHYPTIRFNLKGRYVSGNVHRVVAETYVKFKRPADIEKSDWDATPEAVKTYCKLLHQVNHIDHDRKNYHPSNLEWVSSRVNQRKYQEHRKNK